MCLRLHKRNDPVTATAFFAQDGVGNAITLHDREGNPENEVLFSPSLCSIFLATGLFISRSKKLPRVDYRPFLIFYGNS